jgi:hypothetical protein
MKRIYAFTGKKGHGKSTASKHIRGTRINFKDALVGELEKNFPDLTNAIIDTMEKIDYDGNNPWTFERLVNEKPPLFRTLMQNYGTEVRRGDEPNYWVNQWKNRVRMTEGTVITDDVRFINEAEAVREMGGVIIRIIRNDVEVKETHKSELEMDSIDPDYTISVGTGEQDKLYKQLDDIVQSFKTV